MTFLHSLVSNRHNSDEQARAQLGVRNAGQRFEGECVIDSALEWRVRKRMNRAGPGSQWTDSARRVEISDCGRDALYS